MLSGLVYGKALRLIFNGASLRGRIEPALSDGSVNGLSIQDDQIWLLERMIPADKEDILGCRWHIEQMST